ncbi:MAG TPA: hypothetical protein VGR10_03230, partial [Thermoleophilaceae bacterium]|nr:hypothetical protein [Thermoleophilaceae bacterium]
MIATTRPRLRRVLLYLDAAQSARPQQVAGRARRLLPRALLVPARGAAGSVDWKPGARGVGVDHAPQSGPTAPPHEEGFFAAFGTGRSWESAKFWTDDSQGLLFLFHLHGFRPLATYAAGSRTAEGDVFWAEVIEDWLAAVRSPRSPGWHPYPTSLRVISWSAALFAIERWPITLREQVASEIWRQARYVRRAVEYDIGGNHLIKNAAA